MTDFREGPPRRFMPISVKDEHGYTFRGTMGYEEIVEEPEAASEAAGKGAEC